MRRHVPVILAGLALGLVAIEPGPAAPSESPPPGQMAWRAVCYNVYEPMWLPGIGWRLVLAKRCMNELALGSVTGSRADAA